MSDTSHPDILFPLYRTILARKNSDPEQSYSAKLLAQGRPKIAQKVGEEAVECVIEAIADNREKIISESADLIYHLCVLWVDAGITPSDIEAELRSREGTSGIEEKAQRRC